MVFINIPPVEAIIVVFYDTSFVNVLQDEKRIKCDFFNK